MSGCASCSPDPNSTRLPRAEAAAIRLDGFFDKRIFEPLGMKNTRFFLNDEDVTRLATVYAMGSDGKIARETRRRINDGSWEYDNIPF